MNRRWWPKNSLCCVKYIGVQSKRLRHIVLHYCRMDNASLNQ